MSALLPEDKSNLSRIWSLAEAVFAYDANCATTDSAAIEDALDLLPPIGSNNPVELLARVLVTIDPTMWPGGPWMFEGTYSLDPRKISDPSERNEELRCRKEDLDRLFRWGQRQSPGWSKYQLEAALRQALELSSFYQRVQELGLDGTSAANLAVQRYTQNWLVEGVLTRGEPAVAGGVHKSLKTTTVMDLAISLGSKTPFLGHFPVPDLAPVTFFCAESGRATIQETALRICDARGIRLEDVAVTFRFGVPRISSKEQRTLTARLVEEDQSKVVIFDPLYQVLGEFGGKLDAANLFDMGPRLRLINQVCADVDATCILVHHTGKNLPPRPTPVELHDLAYGGIAEFARQWLLIGRRAPYNNDGRHELILNYGGSAGHSGIVELTVDEGVRLVDGSGRYWKVSVSKRGDALICKKDYAQRIRTAYDQLPRDQDGWVSFNKVREAAALNASNANKALEQLKGEFEVAERNVPGPRGTQQKARCIRHRSDRTSG